MGKIDNFFFSFDKKIAIGKEAKQNMERYGVLTIFKYFYCKGSASTGTRTWVIGM